MKEDGPLDITEIMTVRDFANYLKCHPGTVHRLLKGGKIPGFRVGSDFRFRRADIDPWIAQQPRSQAGQTASKPGRRGRPKK